MAFISQEQKATIAAELKTVVPKTWKYTLAVQHHSTLCFNLKSAPVDFLAAIKQMRVEHSEHRGYAYDEEVKATYWDLNVYHWRASLAYCDAATLAIVEKIMAALYRGNHDNSDITTDYFDVGWYVSFHIGKWNRPYIAA